MLIVRSRSYTSKNNGNFLTVRGPISKKSGLYTFCIMLLLRSIFSSHVNITRFELRGDLRGVRFLFRWGFEGNEDFWSHSLITEDLVKVIFK